MVTKILQNLLSALKWQKDDGSVTVEFALVFIPFVMSIFFLLEVCRVSYIISALDLVISESGYEASVTKSTDQYHPTFAKQLNTKLARIPLIGKGVTLATSVSYCKDIDSLINADKDCSSVNSAGRQLAIYDLKMSYKPLVFDFHVPFFQKYIERKLVFVQEFQRDFSDNENS